MHGIYCFFSILCFGEVLKKHMNCSSIYFEPDGDTWLQSIGAKNLRILRYYKRKRNLGPGWCQTYETLVFYYVIAESLTNTLLSSDYSVRSLFNSIHRVTFRMCHSMLEDFLLNLYFYSRKAIMSKNLWYCVSGSFDRAFVCRGLHLAWSEQDWFSTIWDFEAGAELRRRGKVGHTCLNPTRQV